MDKNKLIIEYTKIEDGCAIQVKGCDRTIDWATIVEKSHQTIVHNLRKECEKSVEKTMDELLQAMADLSGESIDEIKKKLAKTKGDTMQVKVAKLGAEYLEKFSKKLGKKD